MTWTWTCIWRERLSANALELLPFSTGIIFGFLVLATFNNNWDTRERLFGLNKRLKLTDRIFCCCSFWEASVALAVARSQPGRPSSQNTWSISPLCFPDIKFAKSRIQDGCVDVQKSIKHTYISTVRTLVVTQHAERRGVPCSGNFIPKCGMKTMRDVVRFARRTTLGLSSRRSAEHEP